jgi:glutamine synthetase
VLDVFYLYKESILKKAQLFFENSSSLIPKIGIELEFFFVTNNFKKIEDEVFLNNLIKLLKNDLLENFSLIYQVEKEQGVSQVEIKTLPTNQLNLLGNQIEEAKKFIKNFAKENNVIASFDAQPFLDDCGNSMQFNLSLHNQSQENLFFTSLDFSLEIIYALLDYTDFAMILFASSESDYLRFSYDLNVSLFKKGKYTAPINKSFGNNNRTAAIRIPFSKNPDEKRIEYRIPPANCDFFLACSALLLAIIYGDRQKKHQQIFGNAFDLQNYSLKKFPASLEDSLKKWQKEDNEIKKFFEKSVCK